MGRSCRAHGKAFLHCAAIALCYVFLTIWPHSSLPCAIQVKLVVEEDVPEGEALPKRVGVKE